MGVVVQSLEDPRDIRYPFERELYEDALVIYHGTWSSYCPDIEREGLTPDASARRLTKLRRLLDISRVLGIDSESFGLLRGLVPEIVGNCAPRPGIFFSQGFWHARDYATNLG